MSQHAITLEWSRTSPGFGHAEYNRAHDITFKNGQTIRFSAAIAYRGDGDCVDPEEAFVGSLSSCHMLTFLAIASKRGYVVDSYRDEAIGYLEKNEQGKLAITRVEIRPRIAFAGESTPDEQALEKLHHEAHEMCFIANSVTTHVDVINQ